MGTVFKNRDQMEEEDNIRHRKKMETIFKNKEAKRIAQWQEGFKCTFIEDCGQIFPTPQELQAHTRWHQEECKKRMICTEMKCGKKFSNRRAYNEHLEEHREVSKNKVLKDLRNVLLYNKHGILLEQFTKEYVSQLGKHVPYKLFGFNSLYEFLESVPEVVKLVELAEGQTLLIAVPDKATEHIAKMVGCQMNRRDGYNRRTGEVLSCVGWDVMEKIQKASADDTKREVPEFMKKQFQQLVAMDALDEDGLDLNELAEVYDQEFGYSLEVKSYGFHSLKDFVYHGLAGVLELRLDGWTWRVVAAGQAQARPGGGEGGGLTARLAPVKEGLRKVLQANPFGLSETSLVRKYREKEGQPLDPGRLGCKDITELCLLLPDLCRVVSGGPELTILSADRDPGPALVLPEQASLHRLGEIKSNIWALLQSAKKKVPLKEFRKGYEGYHGAPNWTLLGYNGFFDLCQQIPEVCRVIQEKGQYMIKLASDYQGKIKEREAEQETRKISQDVSHQFLLTDGKPGLQLRPGRLEARPGAGGMAVQQEEAGPGWVTVLSVEPGRLTLQQDRTRPALWHLQDAMERWYSEQGAGRRLEPGDWLVGKLVAALDRESLAWQRATILDVTQQYLKLQYLDTGRLAWVKPTVVFHLEQQFTKLPQQSFTVELDLPDDAFASPGSVASLQRIVGQAGGRGWIQESKISGKYTLFVFHQESHRKGWRSVTSFFNEKESKGEKEESKPNMWERGFRTSFDVSNLKEEFIVSLQKFVLSEISKTVV